MRESARVPLADREARVETPEHVAVSYRLADLGSRFTALLLDAAIVLGTLLALWLGLPWLLSRLPGPVPPVLEGWGLGTLTLVSFLLIWGYFVYFEAFRGGQTPGKRRMGIRVVHDGGYPLSLQGAAVRNLLRAVDSQPAFTWLIGGAAMLLHPSTKRLGDLAAGTLVVREQTELMIPEPSPDDGPNAGPPRLSEAEFSALANYVDRRPTLAPELRARIAGKIAVHLDAREGWNRRTLTADAYLLRLYEEEGARRWAAGGQGTASSLGLVRRQSESWRDLRALIDRGARVGLSGLHEDEVSRFAALYREISADLARARTYGASPELIVALERLVGAGHNLLYRPQRPGLRHLGSWAAIGFPSLVRRRWAPIALAAAFLFLPAILGFLAAGLNPGWTREVLPAEMIARAEQGLAREQAGRGYVEVEDVFMPVLASGLIANNVQVTFFAFAGGLAAGAGTILILVMNGIFLGAVAGLFANHGLGLYLWTFVLPHGVIELTAIAIAGGAGLWLGSALVLPGPLTRREALEQRGREAISLIGGTTLLLVAAGLIEGFISPSPLPREVKLALAGLFAAALAVYLGSGWRPTPTRGFVASPEDSH